MNLKFFRPDKKRLSRNALQKEMLNEAIALLVLECEYTNERTVRNKLRNIAKKRLLNK